MVTGAAGWLRRPKPSVGRGHGSDGKGDTHTGKRGSEGAENLLEATQEGTGHAAGEAPGAASGLSQERHMETEQLLFSLSPISITRSSWSHLAGGGAPAAAQGPWAPTAGRQWVLLQGAWEGAEHAGGLGGCGRGAEGAGLVLLLGSEGRRHRGAFDVEDPGVHHLAVDLHHHLVVLPIDDVLCGGNNR